MVARMEADNEHQAEATSSNWESDSSVDDKPACKLHVGKDVTTFGEALCGDSPADFPAVLEVIGRAAKREFPALPPVGDVACLQNVSGPKDVVPGFIAED